MLPFVLVLQLGGVGLWPPPAEATAFDEASRSATEAYPLKKPPPPLPAGFARLQVGYGPPAFSPETSLLRLEGYGGGKLWIELDGGYMIGATGRHVGVAFWGALGRWFGPGSASSPAVTEADYMIGLEVPVRFGSRDLALLVAPRVGVVNGTLDLGGDPPSQSGFGWGGQVSAVSSRYHLSASASFLSAVVGPPGELGLPHNLGGLYFSVGALFDGS
jgi:hypothetical protein